MREAVLKDVDGNRRVQLVPETEAERRQLTRDSSLAQGGIDDRDDWYGDDDWED